MNRNVGGDAADRGRVLGQPLGVRRHQHLNIDPEFRKTPRELQRALDATTTSRRVVEGDQEDAETVGHCCEGYGTLQRMVGERGSVAALGFILSA